MTDRQKPEAETTPAARPPAPSRDEPDSVPVTVAKRAAAEVALGAGNRLMTLVAIGLLAFASVFLMIAWQFGPLVWVEAQQYKKMTSHVDGRIVESWIALEFDAKDVRNPEFWRASTNAASCEVVEYGGDWGAPLRRAFCGTRVPFHDSYPVAKLLPLSEGVPFAWARDQRGFVVPEIRVDATTVQWLKEHAPNKFMHQRWPAATALDWLRPRTRSSGRCGDRGLDRAAADIATFVRSRAADGGPSDRHHPETPGSGNFVAGHAAWL